MPSCGWCRARAAGRPALCHRGAAANGTDDLLHREAVPASADGERIFNHLGVYAFLEIALVARESVVVINDDVPFDVAAMFGCAALTGIGALPNTAGLLPGQSIIVFGLGAVDLMAGMAAAKVAGTTVIAIDPLPEKQELVLLCGADVAGSPDQDAAAVADHAGDGVDVTTEAVGSAPVVEACLGMLARGGAVVSIGLPNPEQRLTVQALQFAGIGVRLVGSYMGDSVPARDLAACLQLWRNCRLPVELLHTDTRPIAERNEGVDALVDGREVRRLFLIGE